MTQVTVRHTLRGGVLDGKSVEAAQVLPRVLELDVRFLYPVPGNPYLYREGFPPTTEEEIDAVLPHGVYPPIPDQTWVAVYLRGDEQPVEGEIFYDVHWEGTVEVWRRRN